MSTRSSMRLTVWTIKLVMQVTCHMCFAHVLFALHTKIEQAFVWLPIIVVLEMFGPFLNRLNIF